ncbi:hypothetical protein AD006_29260 (plasmid) [Pseudonocardia sp. EC080610-09]|uniref:hypothetical protein n=1 Tax=unclassified Pseudonocardia TaxID=2619320 RepID=UPI000706AC1A|nr:MULTISPECIES: hypothetical protein [unclassified Pseudonocardia]ALL79375.1 hypothetical protein AD006_29260 [Pseudonocardia sp. EC080610-09]ALL85347.1 hypothetical protein AD017_29650 [Pseudonocardia sp. EC080619-01]
MYWTATWATTLGAPVPDVVTTRFRPRIQDWTERWRTQHRGQHGTTHSWAAMFTHDAIWPHAAVLDAGTVPEQAPFLDPEVLAAAAALDPAARYDPTLPTAYQRNKTAVVSLFEPHHRSMLPPAKQYFQTALGALVEPCQPQLLAAAGLIDPTRLATADTAVSMTLTATETWLRAALARGARLPGVNP